MDLKRITLTFIGDPATEINSLFEGNIVGKDVRGAIRAMTLGYRKHKNTLRRQELDLIPVKEEEEDV